MLQCLNVARRIQPGVAGLTEYQLEPLPLSGIWINLEGQANGANTAPNGYDLLDCLTNCEVLLAGTTLWQANGRDLAYMGAVLSEYTPKYYPNNQAATGIAQIGILVPFARRLGDVKFGLPATAAGQLRLRLTYTLATGGITNFAYAVDAMYQDQMQSQGFLRCTTLQRTASATGDVDVDLPVGRSLAGVGLFSTTERATNAGARGIGRIKLLRNSEDTYYPSAEWETLQNLGWRAAGSLFGSMDHFHDENVGAAYAQNATTTAQQLARGVGYQQGYVDLDPLADFSQVFDLSQTNRAVIRVTMETAEAFRVLPVEVWPANIGQAASGMRSS